MISNVFDIKKSCVGLEILDDYSVVNEVKCSDYDAVLRLNLPMVMHAHSINKPAPTI